MSRFSLAGRPALLLAAAQLRADLRNPRTGRAGGGRIATTALAYGASGALLAVSLAGALPAHALFVAGSFALVLAAFGVVGSYDELMGRPKENAWLATLPATETQHYAARLLGLGAYVGLMGSAIGLPIGVGTGLANGIWAGLGVGAATAGAVAWMSAVALGALWSLTLAAPQRFVRPALAVLRTALIGALVMGYQWVGVTTETPDAAWWPGSWFVEAAAGRATVGTALLVASVVGLGILFAAVFPRRYFRLIDRLAAGARQQAERVGGTLTAVERRLVRSGPSRAAYGFAVAAFSDDRVVRGRLWPTAFLPLGFVLFGWATDGLGSLFVYGPTAILQTPETQFHLSVLVVLLFCVLSLVQMLQFSDHAEASWVFGTLPEARPRALQLGAQQALFVRVLVPLHLAIGGVLALQMPPAHAAVHALYWLAVVALASAVQALFYRQPPFSRRADRFSGASRFTPLLASIPMAALAAGFQVLVFASIPTALLGSAGLLLVSAGLGYFMTGARRVASGAPRLAARAPAPVVASGV